MNAAAIPPPIFTKPASTIRPPILVVPPSKQFHMGSATVKRNLTHQVDAYFARARHSQTPPANVASFPSADVTPKNEFGVLRTAYDVNGQLWVKLTPCVPNAKPHWYHVGAMAMA